MGRRGIDGRPKMGRERAQGEDARAVRGGERVKCWEERKRFGECGSGPTYALSTEGYEYIVYVVLCVFVCVFWVGVIRTAYVGQVSAERLRHPCEGGGARMTWRETWRRGDGHVAFLSFFLPLPLGLINLFVMMVWFYCRVLCSSAKWSRLHGIQTRAGGHRSFLWL